MAEYYCLVAGLTDYGFDADRKSLNYTALRDEIMETITKKDRAKLELLMGFYDIQNIVNFAAGRRERYTPLGTLSIEDVSKLTPLLTLAEKSDDDEKPTAPPFIEKALRAITNHEWAAENNIDVTKPLDILLYTFYFDYINSKDSGFVKEWCKLDCNIRNISAAYKARILGQDVSKYLIGTDIVTDLLTTSSASDFGLKGEVPFVEELITILSNDNILKKEQDLDLLRIRQIDMMNTFNYFNINVILGYYLKIAMIERWLALDSKIGHDIFEKIVKNLSTMDFTDKLSD